MKDYDFQLIKLKRIFFIILVVIATNSVRAALPADSLAVRMADSEMIRNPEAWSLDFSKVPKWNYTQGLVSLSFLKIWQENGEQKYFDYAKAYADRFIDDEGNIATYKITEFSLDKVNSGKILFILYHQTHLEKYKKAIMLLREQLRQQLRTSEGGYWHKKIYPHQMWLDGIYMATPFLVEYAKEFNDTAAFNEAVLQVMLIQKHTFDPVTGLNYHGWDESKEQKWANPKTGCSPHFWGRAQGWYLMALVDMLDDLPENHPQRPAIISIIQNMVKALVKYQDPATGVWYQVPDQGSRKGNYLEASASSMFVYGMLKAIRKGYIHRDYLTDAQKGFQGVVKQFIRSDGGRSISITHVCSVAGLGGKPYRSGSFDYYIGEPQRDNDPKAVGPFIMACLEMNPFENSK